MFKSENSPITIGVDLGGTNMRVGVVTDGKIIDKTICPCPAKESEEVVLNALCDLINRHFLPETIGIGVGVPTVVDAVKGIIYNATNIPSWKEVHLKETLEKRFGVKVEVNNDANCFALGEKRFGIGKNYQSLVGVTLGTGVGSGLVLDNRLYCGRNTGAGEIGELPYLDNNFEYYCSSGFFVREYSTTGKDAAIAARNGDHDAIAIWESFGRHVGNLMKAVLFAYDPDAIVIGGGIADAFNLYEMAMRRQLSTFPYAESLNRLVIAPSQLNDVAILGASALID